MAAIRGISQGTNLDELIVRFLQGQAGPAEAAALHEWRRASPENERAYREVATVWSELREVEVDTAPPAPALVVSRAEAARAAALRPGRLAARRAWVPAAAAAVLLLAVAGGYVQRTLGGRERVLQAANLATGPGETAMTQLSDGTIVHLAPDSRLQVTPTTGRREVWLEGRAFFAVAKHDDWAFAVRSDAGEAQVLGTRFEFSTEGDGARVVVVDGRVAFAAAGRSVEVGASQVIESSADRPPVVRDVEEVDEILSWMGRSVVFHETPLGQAAREIESRFGATVEIRDSLLVHETISGGFHDRSFEDVIATICRVLDTRCVVEESSAVIWPRER